MNDPRWVDSAGIVSLPPHHSAVRLVACLPPGPPQGRPEPDRTGRGRPRPGQATPRPIQPDRSGLPQAGSGPTGPANRPRPVQPVQNRPWPTEPAQNRSRPTQTALSRPRPAQTALNRPRPPRAGPGHRLPPSRVRCDPSGSSRLVIAPPRADRSPALPRRLAPASDIAAAPDDLPRPDRPGSRPAS